MTTTADERELERRFQQRIEDGAGLHGGGLVGRGCGRWLGHAAILPRLGFLQADGCSLREYAQAQADGGLRGGSGGGFMATLRSGGANATLRDTRGKEIDAACGQLRVRAGAGGTPTPVEIEPSGEKGDR